MNYNDMDEFFDCKYACFSMDIPGVRWDEDWESRNFASIKAFKSIALKGDIELKLSNFDGGFHSEKFTNPTYVDVMKFFDRAIDIVDDHHHVFLEGIADNGELLTGS